MTTPTENQALQADFDGYSANLKNPNIEGERIISAGRAAGLALELGQLNTAQAIWDKEVPAIIGMPTLAQFHAGYKQNPDAFGEFKAFTAPGTALSHALGSYARGLEYAANATQPVNEDTRHNGASHWGLKALTAAGFPEQGAKLYQAIDTGVALERVKVREL